MKKPFYFLTFLLLLTACDNTVFSQYASTEDGIWEKNEEAILTTTPMQRDVTVDEVIELRIERGAYPFADICVIVEQALYPAATTSTDTVIFDLTDGKGRIADNGISVVQYDLPFKQLSLHEGDSVVTVVRHNMKQKSLPGIHDIGIRMTSKD